MRKIFLLLFAFASLYLTSQTTCQSAAPFCAGGTSGITFPATTVQVVSNSPAGPDYDCLNTTPNAAWYYMQIGTNGPLDVLIQGQLASGANGQDVDFICWGPYSSLTNVCNSLTASYVVDCSYSGSYTETLNIPNGVVGQYYMVLITNFANATQNIVFNQINGQTPGAGNTNCSILQVANTSICAGHVGTITATNNGNLTSPNYSIQPTSQSNASGVFTVAPTVTTTYTMFVTGINNTGATVTQTATTTMSVNPQPMVAPTTIQTSCTSTVNAVDLHLTFNPASPAPTYTVAWSSVPNGVTSPTMTSVTSNSVTGAISPNSYAATITANGGCSVVANFTINPVPAPANYTLTPLANVFSVTCAHPNVVVDATNPNLTYTWTNGSAAPVNDSEALFNASTLGTWTITGENPVSHCIQSHTFSVVQNTVTPTGTITPGLQNVTCLAGAQTVSLSASPTVNVSHHIYSPQNIVYSVISHTAIYTPDGGPGNYIDTIRNDLNGCYVVKIFTVTSSDNFPTLNVSSLNNYTVGCNTHSTTTVLIGGDTQPTGGAVTYTIVPPNFPSTVQPGFGSQSTYTFATPGTYTAIIKATVGSCQTKVAFSVIQDIQPPDIHADVPLPVLNCDSMSTLLTAITANSNIAFAWSYPGPNGTPVTVNSATVLAHTTSSVTSAAAGNYTLTLLNNTNGCTSTTVVAMKQNLFPPNPVIAFGSTNHSITCATQTIQLINQSTTSIPLAAGFPTNMNVAAYVWQGPTPQAPLQLSANYIAAVPGPYTLTVRDFNNGCFAVATTTVGDNRIYPSVPTIPTTTLDCSGTDTIRLSPVVTGLAYKWDPKQIVVPGGVSSLTKPQLPVNNPGDYNVTITNTVNGCQINANATVINGSLIAGFTPNLVSGFAPLTVNFTNDSHSNSGSSNSTNSITTVWSFGNCTTLTVTPTSSTYGYCNGTMSISAVSTPTAQYTQPGNYAVVIHSFKGSCTDTAIRYIHVDIPSKLEVPNVFTPNGDGVNDYFFLKVSNLTEINAQIYDRWGHKVYELVSSTGNISWDGMTETGKEAAAGTYFYIIKATGKDGQSYNNKGTITLYR